jgi:outer membrane protein assembly factor BamB
MIQGERILTASLAAARRSFFGGALLFIVLILVGCAPLPLDPSWAAVSVLADTGNLLVAYSDRITLLDPIDGSVVELRDANGDVVLENGTPRSWDVRTTANPATQYYSTPIDMGENVLLVPTFSRRFYEVDALSARVLNPDGQLMNADTLTSHIVGDVLATDDVIYVGLSEGDVVALDRENLREIWKFDTEQGVWATPILNEGVLYVSSMDHNLYALNADNGAELWRVDLGGAVVAPPVLHDSHVYVGSFSRNMYKVSLDGEIVDQYATNDWVWGGVNITDTTLYVGDAAGWLYALDISDGNFTSLWQRQVAQRGIRGTPLVTDDTIVVGARDRRVYWLDRGTGAQQVMQEMRGDVLASPMLLSEEDGVDLNSPIILVSTMAREELLVAYTLDGSRRWVYSR